LVGLRDPLIGQYDSGDPQVFTKHADWATGHGIDFLMVSFNYAEQKNDPAKFQNVIRNPQSNNIRVALMYESEENLPRKKAFPESMFYGDYLIDLDDKDTLDHMFEHFSFIRDVYFPADRHLRVQGRPVVMLYHSGVFIGDVAHAIGTIRDLSQENGFSPYLIGDNVFWDGHTSENLNALRLYDAITASDMIGGRNWSEQTGSHFEAALDAEYDYWLRTAKERGVRFVPIAIPGFDTTPTGKPCCKEVLERTPQKFAERLEIARSHLDTDLKMMLVSSFNLWTENTHVEPSVEDGFKYLQTLRNTLAGD
jgi:hypothetical protein